MLPKYVIDELTAHLAIPRTGENHVIVRPGLGLAMYYARPMHEIADAITEMVERYLGLVPSGAITALCGTSAWGKFQPARLKRQLKQLHNPEIDYTSIDLGSGPLLASVGPYGWHVNGGNLFNAAVRPNNTNVVFYEFPPNELDRVGVDTMIDWVASIAAIAPFNSGQFGWSFNQLQRSWTNEAEDFIGGRAMRFLGFDIMDTTLARHTRALVPNCSWLTILGEDIIARLGGVQAITDDLPAVVRPRLVPHGLLLRAGEHPPIGDTNRGAADLGPLREVARVTKPARLMEPFLNYGTEHFQSHWLDRFDV